MDLKKLAHLSRSEVEKMNDAAAAETSSQRAMLEASQEPAKRLRDEIARSHLSSLGFNQDPMAREQRRLQDDLDRNLSLHREQLNAMYERQREQREREDEQREYLRRTAEASEAALEEERQGRQRAEADAATAKEAETKAEERAAIAEARAQRSEEREIKTHRGMWIAIWIALASLAVAAWPFFKEAVGL